MYTLKASKEFNTSHFLTGGDFGVESQLHSHRYTIGIILQGENLNEHGYLFDINDLENHLDKAIFKFSDKTLNELDDFKGLNPSLENFARIFWREISQQIFSPRIKKLLVEVQEDDKAVASFSHDF